MESGYVAGAGKGSYLIFERYCFDLEPLLAVSVLWMTFNIGLTLLFILSRFNDTLPIDTETTFQIRLIVF